MPQTPARRTAVRLAVVAAVLAAAAPARAEYIIDLTAAPPSQSQPITATYQDAIFAQNFNQPTGTGVIDPFVRIQRTGTEAGYNTDARPVEFQTKDSNQWTHSLALSSLETFNLNGVDYYKFLLDVNEKGTDAGSLLSMNDFRVYLGDRPDLTGYTGTGFSNGASQLVYDIDAGANGDTRVDLNYRLNSGSGSGDLAVYVPTSAFQPTGDLQWVYLYSGFGDPYPCDAGFEEWYAATGPQNHNSCPVPAPAGLWLGLIGAGGLAARRAVRRVAGVAV